MKYRGGVGVYYSNEELCEQLLKRAEVERIMGDMFTANLLYEAAMRITKLDVHLNGGTSDNNSSSG